MKSVKRILCCVICLSILFGMLPPIRARAEDDPAQTLGTVSVPLYHNHGNESTGCYGTVYKSCGGSIESQGGSNYVCSRCGARFLGTVGSYHDGYYVSELTCTEHYVGSFYIERAEYGRNVNLIAGISSRSALITEYEISWDAEGAYESDGKSILPVTERGTFHATLRYYDSKLKTWKSETLSYTELSAPTYVKYRSEGNLINSLELEYGETLPVVEVPRRTGYIFKGYYDGSEAYHDEEGRPVGKGTKTISRSKLTLDASWEPRRFTLRYGSDVDGDGVPDSFSALVYDAMPPDLGLGAPQERPGWLFEGYYIGEKKIYDENGTPLSIWTELPDEEELVLRERWSVRKYRITAGAGEVIELEYEDELPRITPPQAQEGKVFDGYYYEDRLIYDSEGQPVDDFPELYELGEVQLEERWHDKTWQIRYGDDADGDGLADKVVEIRYGEELPDIRPKEPAPREGYEFAGYSVNGIDAYDKDGNPFGEWKPSLDEGSYELVPKWVGKNYTLRYGADRDGDGLPDEELLVTFGQAYPAVDIPELEANMVFDGYYLGDEAVYDATGQPTGLWRWDTDLSQLSLRYHELPKRSDDEEKQKEERERIEREREEREREEREREERERKEKEEQEEREKEEREREEKEREEKEREEKEREEKEREEKEREEKEKEEKEREEREKEERERKEKEEKEREEKERKRKEKEKKEKEKEGEKENGGESADPGEGGKEEKGSDPGNGGNESVSANSASDNSVSDNEPGTDKRPGPAEKRKPLRQGGAAEVTEPDPEERKEDPLTLRKLVSRDEDEAEEESAESADEAEATEDPVPEAKADEVKLLPEEEPTGPEEKKTVANEKRSASPVVRKVATVGAVTVGGLGGIVGVYAGLVYLLAMAEVDTICPDGRKKRLGRLSIRSEKGKAFLVRISRELLEQCETDTLCLRIPALFVLRYHDRTIVVQSRGKKQEKKISREIRIRI